MSRSKTYKDQRGYIVIFETLTYILLPNYESYVDTCGIQLIAKATEIDFWQRPEFSDF